MKPSVPPPDRRTALAAWYLCNDQRFLWNAPLLMWLCLCFHLFLLRSLSEDAQANLRTSELELRALEPKSIPDADNAAGDYDRAHISFVAGTFDTQCRAQLAATGLPAEVERVEVRSHLAANAQALRDLLAAAQKRGCSWKWEYASGLPSSLPYESEFRLWRDLLSVQARVSAHQGNHAEAARALRAIAALARHVNEAETCQDIRYATYILEGQVETLEAIILWDTPETKEQVAAYRDALWLESRSREWLQRALEYERAKALFVLDRVAASGQIPRGWQVGVSSFRAFDYSPERRSVNEAMAEVLERVRRGELLERGVAQEIYRKHKYGPAGIAQSVCWLPSLLQWELFNAEDRARVADAALACLQFRLARGRDPRSFDELTPTFLPVIPHDVFHGQPLRFRHAPEGMTVCDFEAGTAKQYLKGLLVVYSLGADGTDDGGADPATKPIGRGERKPDDNFFRLPPLTSADRNRPSDQEFQP